MALVGLGGLTVPGAYIGMAMMVGGGIWASYEQRKAMREAMDAASRAQRGIKGNTRTSQAPIPIAYGRTRIGGNIIYQITGGGYDGLPNATLHTVYGVSEGPIEMFEGMWVEDTKVWEITSEISSADITSINSGFLPDTGRHYNLFTNQKPGETWTTYNAIDFRLGCNSQDWFTQINSITGATIPGWGFTGKGWDLDGNHVDYLDPDFNDRYPMVALAYTRFLLPAYGDPPYQGIPTCSWEVRGKRVRDINNINSLHWTDNPAHILFDIMTNKQYGWSIPASKIDIASFQDVGSFCAGSGSGWVNTSEQFSIGDTAPYQHTAVTSWLLHVLGDEYTMTWNPNGDSLIKQYRNTFTWGPRHWYVWEPSSFSKAPMVAGSLSITCTISLTGYTTKHHMTYGMYGDASGNLRFIGYKQLGMDGKTLLEATTVMSGLTQFMPYQDGYMGGDISSGTIIGAVDYATGSLSWNIQSLNGRFSGQEYDSNAWIFFEDLGTDCTANWFYGYGGQVNVGKKYLEPGNITIVASTSYGLETLTETDSGSGILKSDVMYDGRWAGGGSINYGTGELSFYFKGDPVSVDAINFDVNYWVNMGYSFNGIVGDPSPAVDVVRDICQHFRGYLVYNQGIYQLKADRAGTPVFAFDEDNIKAGSFVIVQTPISERPNRVRVKYTDRSKNYAQMDVIYEPENPIISLDDYVIEHVISLPKCVYKDQAFRMAQTLGRQAQLGNTCQFITGQDGTNVDIGNLITVTWPPAGWTDKEFRVVEIEEKPDEEFALSCVEYDASVYADEYTG